MKTFEGIGNTLQEKLDCGILVEETNNPVKEVIYTKVSKLFSDAEIKELWEHFNN